MHLREEHLLRRPGLRTPTLEVPLQRPQLALGEAARIAPLQLAEKLGERGIFTWDGHYFALDLARRLGVESSGGWLRIGLVHYNTEEEVRRVVEELKKIADGK